MRLLILGGTVFLGRAIARYARDAGDDVVCVARGVTGDPVEGVEFVAADRSAPDGLAALTGEFDAAVDVARYPGHVRHAVRALAGRVGHFGYVSSISVYADPATPGQRPASAPVVDPAPPDFEDPAGNGFANYGPCKRSCELAALDGFDRVLVCRAGAIVGPEDANRRFVYWLERLDAGGEVLAPGAPDESVQYVDVRDLAAWLVESARTGVTGVYDGTGPAMGRAAFLSALAVGVAHPVRFTWVPAAFLLAQGVRPWDGPRSLPLWLPAPEYAGFLDHDVTPTLAAGLRIRPLVETARDTRGWLAAGGRPVSLPGQPGGLPVGLEPEDEAGLLEAWHRESGR